ncbi:DUF3349 domain-containing protein [Mycobacterium sp. 852002-40037_SCH5390672]|uniref:DUF3349 domain-containing protein n=1 Tax=Mycobacterium sp. 852002-40037_SCH5390672 TaxID=1834089 RepID=UPI0008049316|nr:DUF3349 domain-containing protein [Mycobacterium sp. 852002-40037_SCH5390672]OBB92072.1 hypothetical protein A5782_14485 [Mycobacterium sp. 852002-40037_SCH5390672]
MSLGHRVSSVVAFLRAGCPKGAPDVGYGPLLALLPRRVTDDEVITIARKLRTPGCRKIDNADVGVAIIGVTDAMPSTYDVERVLVAMESAGGQQD